MRVLNFTSILLLFANVNGENIVIPDTIDPKTIGENISGFISDVWNKIFKPVNKIDWNKLNELPTQILDTGFSKEVTQSFQNIEWNKVTDKLFSKVDGVTDHVVASFKKSKDILRDLKNCDPDGAMEGDTDQCRKAKDFYNEMKSTVNQLKEQILKIESQTGDSERQIRAAKIGLEIETIEASPLRSSATLNGNSILVVMFCSFLVFIG